MRKLLESIEIVNLRPGQIITVPELEKLLWKVRSDFQYLTITMKNNKYITINYNRDMTISISSNLTDIWVIREIQYVKNYYAIDRISNYLFKWIKFYNQ